MPKFNAETSGGTGKKFEGVKEVVIVSAGYYQKGQTWKDKVLIDDVLADESNDNHAQVFIFKLASGASDVLNNITKYGRASNKFSDWGKAYKLFGLKATDDLQQCVGLRCKVLFYADAKGYTSIWDRMYAANVPDSQVEDDFTQNLERSDYLRKKVGLNSRYALDKAPATVSAEDDPF